MAFKTDMGYAVWCQRGQCTRCKFKGCECPHHIGGTPDQSIIDTCKANAVARGWVGAKCQESKHTFCKKTGCACKCHSSEQTYTPPAPIVKKEYPIASEENVLELQERIYAAEASFKEAGEIYSEELTSAKKTFELMENLTTEKIAGFDKRLTTMENTKKVSISVGEKAKPVDVGVVHKTFAELVEVMALGLTPYMVGAAGGGKSEAARMACKAIGLDPNKLFFGQAVGAQTTQSQIMGYYDANGEYVESMAYKACTQGGVWFLDEVDAANAGVMTVANGILANKYVGFPCGMVERHPNTRFIVAANTFGKGADHIYVGRNQLDAATLDRFVWINWDYDWDLTKHIAQNDEWTTHIERLYICASEMKLRVVIGPRKAIYGAKLLAAGWDRERVEHKVLWASIDTDDKSKIVAKMRTMGWWEEKQPDHPMGTAEAVEKDIYGNVIAKVKVT